MSDALYSATSTAWGGREGRVVSSDERLDLQLSIPAAIGGDDGPGTNPEQLFATGWAACFHSALKLVARQHKADVSESAVSVTVSLVMNTEGGFDIAGHIEAELPGLDHATASALVDEAHRVCPYSRATRNNITVEVSSVEP
jgi:osmotically inducible protein OsmC